MSQDYLYPNQIQLSQIVQELLPDFTTADPLFSFMPLQDSDSHLVEWEQEDNYVGLQQVRGLNGDPGRVKKTGGKRYAMQPGVYGEFETIDENELTTRRPFGTLTGGVDITDLVVKATRKLLQRRIDRIKWIGWTLAATGTFSVSDGAGVLHTDAYTMQTFATDNPWSDHAAATPLADLRACQLKSRGYSVDFGRRATLYVNRGTANDLLSNTNAADLYGRRTSGLATVNNMEDLGRLLAMDDLPGIAVHDRGYYDESGVFQLYIPDGTAILVGQRDGNEPIGSYKMTRNATNGGSAGAYTRIEDQPIPRLLKVHDGHNGGPALMHPAAIVRLDVSHSS